jgi:hypothetical protein
VQETRNLAADAFVLRISIRGDSESGNSRLPKRLDEWQPTPEVLKAPVNIKEQKGVVVVPLAKKHAKERQMFSCSIRARVWHTPNRD